MGELIRPVAFRRTCPFCKTRIVWTDEHQSKSICPQRFRVGECDCRVIFVVVAHHPMLNVNSKVAP